MTWWAPGQIRYTPEQVSWLLEHSDTLHAGYWPKDPRETGYVGRARKHRHGPQGNFCAAIEIIAELDQRLELLPSWERWFLESTLERGETYLPRFNHCLRRICGWRRKRT